MPAGGDGISEPVATDIAPLTRLDRAGEGEVGQFVADTAVADGVGGAYAHAFHSVDEKQGAEAVVESATGWNDEGVGREGRPWIDTGFRCDRTLQTESLVSQQQPF